MKKYVLFLAMAVSIGIGIHPGLAATKAKRDDVIVRVEATLSTMNPLKATNYVDMFEINQMYEALTWVDDKGAVVPVLAESWDVSADGKEYIFHIRKGVKFHNGSELKASDVAFTINTAKKTPQVQVYVLAVDHAEVVSDYECKVVLAEPFAPLASFLANIRILNEKFYTEHKGEIDLVACGTGPYVLQEIDLNTTCKMTAFPDYWKGEASIKKIHFTIIADDTTTSIAYMAGEVDFIMTAASQFLEISAQPDLYSFTNIPTKHTANFYMNHDKAPFNDVRVRKAINHLIDRKAMIQVAFEGFAAPAFLQGNESCFGVDYSKVVKYDYSIEEAKKLFAEAGYANGINLGKLYSIAGSYFDKTAVVFQEALAQAGGKIEIVGMDSTSLMAESLAGNFDMCTSGSSFMTDFAYAYRQYGTYAIGVSNFNRYSNPEVDRRFQLAQAESNPEVRKQLYGEIVHTITGDAVEVAMFHKDLLFAWTKGLNCVVHPNSGMPYFVYNWSW